MMSDASRYDLKVGDIFQDGRAGRSGDFEIADITPDGNCFQLRWASMSDGEHCPYVTAERLFAIANMDGESRRRFTREEMLLAFAAGFRSSAEGHNGECNHFTDAPCGTTRGLLFSVSARQQLGRDFSRFLEEDMHRK